MPVHEIIIWVILGYIVFFLGIMALVRKPPNERDDDDGYQ